MQDQATSALSELMSQDWEIVTMHCDFSTGERHPICASIENAS